jgi:hypothetical protein
MLWITKASQSLLNSGLIAVIFYWWYLHVVSAFPWLTIIGHCWVGLLSRKNLQTKGVVSSESTKKNQFEEKLCYFVLKKTIALQEEGLLFISSLGSKFQNQFSTAAATAAA